jgi:hypothetical protein
MGDLKLFISRNRLNFTLFIFLVFFGLIHTFQPSFIYNEEGQFRPFGIGYRHKTIIPIWLVSIITAIFSYLITLSFLMYL